MKRVMGLSLMAGMLFIAAAGCGGSSEPTNVMQDANQSAVDAYDAAIAEEENLMNDEPPAEE
ncbi:MAG: hypothetical protein ACR2NZ_14930 [Rubripirellula sp.]